MHLPSVHLAFGRSLELWKREAVAVSKQRGRLRALNLAGNEIFELRRPGLGYAVKS